MILSIRTDKPEAEIGLFADSKQLAYMTWQAHRELSDTIHHKLEELLGTADKRWEDIGAVIFYKGPGSFTGLRIGASVAQAISSSLAIPLVATNTEDWLKLGFEKLKNNKNEQLFNIEYGSEARTTKPVK